MIEPAPPNEPAELEEPPAGSGAGWGAGLPPGAETPSPFSPAPPNGAAVAVCAERTVMAVVGVRPAASAARAEDVAISCSLTPVEPFRPDVECGLVAEALQPATAATAGALAAAFAAIGDDPSDSVGWPRVGAEGVRSEGLAGALGPIGRAPLGVLTGSSGSGWRRPTIGKLGSEIEIGRLTGADELSEFVAPASAVCTVSSATWTVAASVPVAADPSLFSVWAAGVATRWTVSASITVVRSIAGSAVLVASSAMGATVLLAVRTSELDALVTVCVTFVATPATALAVGVAAPSFGPATPSAVLATVLEAACIAPGTVEAGGAETECVAASTTVLAAAVKGLEAGGCAEVPAATAGVEDPWLEGVAGAGGWLLEADALGAGAWVTAPAVSPAVCVT